MVVDRMQSDQSSDSKKRQLSSRSPSLSPDVNRMNASFNFDYEPKVTEQTSSSSDNKVQKKESNDKWNLKPLNILIVDDSSSTRKMLSRYLRMSKVCLNPEEAYDGINAVEKVKEKDIDFYDVILMDYIMPNLEGPPATEQIRALGYQGLVIGLTGQVQPEELHLFFTCGANEVFAKPVNIAKLQDVIRFHILKKEHDNNAIQERKKMKQALDEDDDDDEADGMKEVRNQKGDLKNSRSIQLNLEG
jgi:CheY-like chemotaxis protein